MDITGTSISQDDYLLADVAAPQKAGEAGPLTFTVRTADGSAATAFTERHGKALHLIVVRTDGSEYRHLHPDLDTSTGMWTASITWDAAGTYRIFADTSPEDAAPITLSHTIDVAGDFHPAIDGDERRHAVVDRFDVHLDGALRADEAGLLTIAITEDGQPVQRLEPYLGAFGHLVALRRGDLAYLHVHALGDDPAPGAVSGPEIAFHAVAPTAGRYFLYLDFRVDGTVRTASFVLDVAARDAEATVPDVHAAHLAHAH